jgi:hypothetical protein
MLGRGRLDQKLINLSVKYSQRRGTRPDGKPMQLARAALCKGIRRGQVEQVAPRIKSRLSVQHTDNAQRILKVRRFIGAPEAAAVVIEQLINGLRCRIVLVWRCGDNCHAAAIGAD